MFIWTCMLVSFVFRQNKLGLFVIYFVTGILARLFSYLLLSYGYTEGIIIVIICL